jgi:hypothetical protein
MQRKQQTKERDGFCRRVDAYDGQILTVDGTYFMDSSLRDFECTPFLQQSDYNLQASLVMNLATIWEVESQVLCMRETDCCHQRSIQSV